MASAVRTGSTIRLRVGHSNPPRPFDSGWAYPTWQNHSHPTHSFNSGSTVRGRLKPPNHDPIIRHPVRPSDGDSIRVVLCHPIGTNIFHLDHRLSHSTPAGRLGYSTTMRPWAMSNSNSAVDFEKTVRLHLGPGRSIQTRPDRTPAWVLVPRPGNGRPAPAPLPLFGPGSAIGSRLNLSTPPRP